MYSSSFMRLLKTSTTYKDIWNISFPIIIGNAVDNLINITDTVFSGWLGGIALGAVAIGSLFYMILVMIGMGFGIGTQIVMARKYGEENYKAIGETFSNSFLALFPLSLLLFLLTYFQSTAFLSHFISSPEILHLSTGYLHIRIYGIFFVYCNILFRSFYVGTMNTKIIGIISLITALLNALLAYLFMFGKSGFAPMGINGASTASLIAEASGTILYFIYTRFFIEIKTFFLFHFFYPAKNSIQSLLIVAMPLMIQFCISFSSWFIVFLIIEHMGVTQLAVSNISRSIYMIMLLPIWGNAAAASSLVSYKIGQNNHHEVMPLLIKICIFSLCTSLIVIVPVLVFSKPIVALYTNNPEWIILVTSVIKVLFGGALILSISIIFFNGVSGIGNTLFSLLMEIVIISIYLGYTYMASGLPGKNIVLVWCSELVYGLFMLLFSLLYLNFGKWKRKQT